MHGKEEAARRTEEKRREGRRADAHERAEGEMKPWRCKMGSRGERTMHVGGPRAQAGGARGTNPIGRDKNVQARSDAHLLQMT